MESSSQDRNLPASERKLDKAREDGQVARSRDLAHLAVLGTGAFCLIAFGPMMFDRLQNELSLQLLFNAQSVHDPLTMLHRLGTMVAVGLVISAIFGGVVLTVTVGSTVAAGGWVASLKPIMPDFSRLNPISGLGHLFSKDKFFEVVKMVFRSEDTRLNSSH